MKQLVIGAVMIGATVHHMAAQGASTMERRGVPTYSAGLLVVQQLGDALVISNPRRWGLRSPIGRQGDRAFGDWGYAPDPYFYPEDYNDDYPALPSVIVVTPAIQQGDAPPQATPAPAPKAARLEMREYHWPSSGRGSSARTYSIVSKDGRVQFAALVWVQDDGLCYYTLDHSTGRIPIESIDRQATRQRNADQQLLWLLPKSQTDLFVRSDHVSRLSFAVSSSGSAFINDVRLSGN